MQHQNNYYCSKKSRSKSASPKRNEASNRRHYRSRSSPSVSKEKIASKSTSSPSTNISKPNKELAAKLTRKVYNVNNNDNGASGSKKNPKQIRRMIDDPQQIGVVRRFGEGATPIFEREEFLKRDEARIQNFRPKHSSRESSSGRGLSLSPSKGSKRYDKNELEKSAPSSSRQSRSRERRLYNKDKKKKSASRSPAKTSYFLDSKREEDRIRRKYGEKKLDERRSRSRSRDKNRTGSRRRSRSRSRSRRRSRLRSRSRSRSRSRLSHHSMMPVHPYPIAYYPPPYPYPAPYLPMDPAWRPYPPYPFPPRLPYRPFYLPHGPRYGLPGPSGQPPYFRNFRPRFNRR